jgi:hypothetical protein
MIRLSRRTVLKGVGAALGLPLLDAMAPSAAFARGDSPLRMAFVFVPNGVNLKHWRPAAEGALGELPSTLSPLENVKKDVSVLGGLAHHKANANGDGAGDHARACATFLTGMQAVKTDGKGIRVGTSVDQVAAKAIGEKTKLPSLEIGCERGAQSGNCDSGYSCAYSCNVSWRSPTAPSAKLVAPREVFARLFGDPEQSMSAQERARRAADNASVLDLVLDDAKRLRGSLGGADQSKLDDYLESVRAVEKRIQAEPSAERRVPKLELPEGIPDYPTHLKLLMELLALAFQADATRLATLMTANDGNDRSYPFLEVREGHHTLSHHGGNKGMLEKIRKIDQWHVAQFATLLERLKGMREGDGSVLDHSMIVYGGAIGDGNAHNHDDLPILLAGKGSGTLTPGRHVKFRNGTPMANLFLSMLDRLNVRVASFGDSTGRLEGI